jgi:hypothetical protein
MNLFGRLGMDSIPLYFDQDQLANISSSYNVKHSKEKEAVESAIKELDIQSKSSYFTEMESAIDYVDKYADAIIHVNTWFVMMDFIHIDKDPGKEIMEAKALRFEYNTFDIYDYSDDYFKKTKVKIPMCLQFKHLYYGDSRGAIISTYIMLFGIFRKSKISRLEVLGRLQKRYNFYKIDPVYVSINMNEILPL